MYVSPNIKAPSCNYCCSGKAIGVIYSESVLVASFIKRVKRTRLVILTPVACLALQYFSTLSQKKGRLFEIKNFFDIKCVFLFSLQFCTKNFSL